MVISQTGTATRARSRRINRYKIKRRLASVLRGLAIGLFLFFFLFIFFWMILMSLKDQRTVTAYPPVWFFKPTFVNYVNVFKTTPFSKYLLNSSIIGTVSVAFSLLLGLPAAYAVARYRLTGLAFPALLMRMLPGIAFLVPFFVIFNRLGLKDSYLGMIIAHMTLSLPLIIWIMIGFFEDIPSELEDAAVIDGCGKFMSFYRVALPLCLPGVTAVTILGFIFSWNNFMFVLVLGGPKTMTLPLAVYSFISFECINWGALAAAATLITIPIIILSVIIQRYLVAGLTTGAVK